MSRYLIQILVALVFAILANIITNNVEGNPAFYTMVGQISMGLTFLIYYMIEKYHEFKMLTKEQLELYKQNIQDEKEREEEHRRETESANCNNS